MRKAALVATLGLGLALGAAYLSAAPDAHDGAEAHEAADAHEMPDAHDAPHRGHAASPDAATHEAAGLTPLALPPGSLFQLESSWTTADGREVRLEELGGCIRVLAMVYSHCEHACPRIVADMKRIRRELADEAERVEFVLVSLDPERDSVARLAAFAAKTGLDEGWTLLRADAGTVRELSAALGVRYRRIDEENILHSNLISVLDADGVVVHRQVGLGVDPEATIAVIRERLAE